MGLGHMLTFEHFEDLLQQFGGRNKECEDIAKTINIAVNNSCKIPFCTLLTTQINSNSKCYYSHE